MDTGGGGRRASVSGHVVCGNSLIDLNYKRAACFLELLILLGRLHRVVHIRARCYVLDAGILELTAPLAAPH